MKALTIREPWATLILSGHKTVETRVWKTDYKGPILLHVGKTAQPETILLSDGTSLLMQPNNNLLGKVVGIVFLNGCRKMERADERAACCPIYTNAQAWILGEVIPITPFEMRGQLQLFETPYSYERMLERKIHCEVR